MKMKQGLITNTCPHFKPHILMVLAQVGYTFMYVITEASFNHGMSPFVYVTYRHIVAGLIMLGKAYTLKRYPAQLSLATWMNLVGAAQSAAFTVSVQHKKADCTIGFNIDLWSTLYGVSLNNTAVFKSHSSKEMIIAINLSGDGVVISGIVTIQLWCTEAKGPVFVTMFNHISTIFVAFLVYFVLGEKLYVGSVLGGVIVIVGLYLLLWGKEHDEVKPKLKEHEDPNTNEFLSNANSMKDEPYELMTFLLAECDKNATRT